jgi:putative ABC transport system substrate-binding protein
MAPHRREVIEEAGRTLKILTSLVTASDAKGLDASLQAMAQGKPEGLIFFEDPVFFHYRFRIIEFAAKHKVLMVCTQSGWAQQGCLVEYAPQSTRNDSPGCGICRSHPPGAKPADLPIEQPTKFELVINSRPPRRSVSRSRRRWRGRIR